MIKKLIDKYKNMPLPVKMAFWFLVCSFTQKGIGMITTPIFTRIMSEGEYGRYGIYTSWYSIIGVFVTLSISGNCFTRGLVVLDDEKKKKELTSSLYGLSITLLLGWTVVYLIFRNQIKEWTTLTDYQFLMMGIDTLMVTACHFWINTKRVRYEYKGIAAISIAYTVLRPALAILAVLNVPSDLQVEGRITGGSAAATLLYSWIIFYIFIRGKKFFDKHNWKYALGFCLPLIPHYLSKSILNESDRIMIGHFVGNAEVGYYSVAYTIAGIMMIFNSSVAQSLDPWIYSSIKKRNLERIGTVSYKITAIIALLNFMVMAIAPEVLIILAPANYANAIWVIPPVTASVFFIFMYDLFASFQFYFKKTKWIAIGSCAGAALNVILNWIFIPMFGYIAAGYTTLVCYILYGVLHYFFMRKVCKGYLDGYKVYDWRIIFGIGALLVLLSFVMLVLYNYPIIRYIVLGVLAIVVFCLRKTIIGLVKRIREKD
ncbi:MAG: oligosaccharide flippase family protein [Ruminococcus sp.]|nr:oligosaccharide flippase family protein [Ruminococcus sp.]